MKTFLSLFAMVIASVTFAQPIASSTTITDPAEVVKEFFDAYRNHNREKVAALLHPEVVWIQPGDNRLAGVKKSREEVLAMGKQMGELSAKTIQLAEIRITNTNGSSVACVLRWKAVQPTGKTLDVENVDIYTIENGKIVSVKIFSADLEQENSFWGK
jgi:ketosteroid isomerase-like protein